MHIAWSPHVTVWRVLMFGGSLCSLLRKSGVSQSRLDRMHATTMRHSYRVIIFNEMRTRDSEQESQHIPQTIGFASSRSDRLHTAQS